MIIGPDCHVTIAYSLFEEDSNEAITLGDDDEQRVTVEYVHGYGQVLPALEQGLLGRRAGEAVKVSAPPEDAFGEREPDGVLEIEKEGLAGSEDLEVGEEFLASGPEGDLLMRVLEVRDDTIVVDTNHPLAGKRVRFEVEVLGVRNATEEEIAEAQAELDEAESACGCGHDHSHDHGHASEDEAALAMGRELLQLGKSKRPS